MKTLRPKQADWGKPFKIYEKREEFNRVDEPDSDLIISRSKIQKKPEIKKEEIIKPRIEIVAAPSRSNNTEGIPLNYVRLTPELNLPRADKYELSEVDCLFLSANQNKFLFGGKKVLTIELLERCFVELEVMTGRDFSTLPKSLKSKFKTFLETQLEEMAKMDKLDEFVDLIYNRWRSRRDELKNPLLRQLWRPQADDTSHFLAFRPRQKDKEKRNLRRINKSNEDDAKLYMENLLKEVEKTQGIVDRVIAREKWKLALLNLDMQRFNIEARCFKDEPLFVKQVDKKQILTLRENYQVMKAQYDLQKETTQQQQQLETIVETTSIATEDPKAAICNFLANLSNLASQVGIDWESLNGMNTGGASLGVGRPPIAPISSFISDSRPSPVVVIPSLINTSIVKFNIRELENKQQKFLLKNFQQTYSQSKPERPPREGSVETNNYFALKQRRLCQNFFFEQDQEQGKDVKKGISASFKKYLSNKAG